jgi:hypothetical protein
MRGRREQSLLDPEHAQLALIWADVIGIDVHDIRASDNFFDLGGDSLLVLRAVQQAATDAGPPRGAAALPVREPRADRLVGARRGRRRAVGVRGTGGADTAAQQHSAAACWCAFGSWLRKG